MVRKAEAKIKPGDGSTGVLLLNVQTEAADERINSEFKTANLSEEGQELSNRDYFGYVEMDDFACYVLADSLDENHLSIARSWW